MENLRWLASAPNRAALRVALVFLVLSALWIVFSDQAARALFGDTASLSAFQTAKGLFYVGVTTLILFFLVRRLVHQLADRTTDLLRAREAAAAAMRRTEIESRALERAKSQFLSSVSHELRTPLNAVIGFADMLRDPGLTLAADRVRDYAGEIATAGHNLLELVEGIVACAEAEAGQPLNLEKLSAREEVARAIAQVRVRAQQHRTSIALVLADNVGIRADPLALRQILFALLDNAVAHTPDHTHVRVEGYQRADGGTVLIISDDGPGLPPEVRAGIGHPFLRGGDPLTAGTGGLGLGLYLASLLVSRHGGCLLAEEMETGSRIRLEFPA